MHDVTIVGAGPAGLSCARELARGGARVLLLDKSERPGAKACGGGLTEGAWELAGIDPSVPRDGEIPFDTLGAGAGSLSTGETLMVVVDRVRWQGRLLAEARDLGVEVLLGKRAAVNLDQSGVLVGADGASSSVRRKLGLERRLSVLARQLTMDSETAGRRGIRADIPRVFFEPSLFGCGYAWIFPAGRVVRVGCGASSAMISAGALARAFDAWLLRRGLDRTVGLFQSGSIGCDYQGHRFGRVFLVGDAAGLASPVTGEGIGQALISGREVAREILDSTYRSKVIEDLSHRHRRTHRVLASGRFGRALFRLSPLLLGLPLVARAALERYA